MKVIHSPPITIEGQRPKEPETISFWFNAVQGSVSLWKFLSYRKLAGDLCMRINKSPSDWYAWRLSASLGKVSVPITGSPPISLSKFATTEHSFKFNRKLFDPRTDWREKNIIVKIAGSKLWITIQRALPRAPGPGYAPIHGHTSQDLTLELLMDGPELEGCIGVGFINNGCPVKPMRPPNPYGLTNDGFPDDGWT